MTSTLQLPGLPGRYVPRSNRPSLKENLISYWPLDEPAGTRRDATITGHTLTDNNTVTGAEGPSLYLPRAAQHTAANIEYLSRVDNDTLSVEAQSFSVCAWAYSDAFGTDRMVVAKDSNAAGNREYHLIYANSVSRWVMRLQNSTTNLLTLVASAAGAPATATWYFLTITYDHPTRRAKLYVNAGTPAEDTASGDVTASGAPFTIGAFGNTGARWDGRTCGVGFWKRVLTADDITWLYNGGIGRPFPWWTEV